jgi:hypothetical protein
VHLVCRLDGVADSAHDLGRKLKTQIHALCPDVKKQVAGSGNSMARARMNLPEHMQLFWANPPKKFVPRVGPEAHNTGKPSFDVTKSDRTHDRGEVRAERPNRPAGSGAWLDRHNEEDRGTG